MSVMSNDDRAERAARAIAAYQGDDSEFYLQDLVCDLGHWRDRYPDQDAGMNDDIVQACRRGMEHYDVEVGEEAMIAEVDEKA